MDAESSIMQAGYTRVEAKRIRPWLPQHFHMHQRALLPTNIEFWRAYAAVMDMQNYPTGRFKLTHSRQRTFFTFDNYDRLVYESPTLKTDFLALEFIRHFGPCISKNLKRVPGEAFHFEMMNGAIKLRRGDLQMCLRQLENPPKPDSVEEWTRSRAWIGYQMGRPELPVPAVPTTAADAISLMLHISMLIHSNVTRHNLHDVETPFLTRQLPSMEPVQMARAINLIPMLGSPEFEQVRMKWLDLYVEPKPIRHMYNLIPYLYVQGVGTVGMHGVEKVQRRLTEVRSFRPGMSLLWTDQQFPGVFVLEMPPEVFNLFPLDEWKQGIRAKLQ